MPAIPDSEREEQLEKVVELVLMGFTSPNDLIRNDLASSWEVAKNRLAIAHRRIRNRYKTVDIEKMRRKEIGSLRLLERKLWADYNQAREAKDRKTAALLARALKDVKERLSKMLGMDAPTSNLNLNIDAGQKELKVAIITDVQAKQIADNLQRIHGELTTPQSEPVGSQPATDARGEEVPAALRLTVPAAPHDESHPAVSPGTASPPAG